MVYYTAIHNLKIQEKHVIPTIYIYVGTVLACTVCYKTVWGKNGIHS